jgi:endoglucanase
LGRVQRALDYARQAKLRVILDLHNYGSFALGEAAGSKTQPRRLVLGSTELPIDALADLWTRLAEATRDDPVVIGYDVMNEPVTLAAKGEAGARLWEQASQAAVGAIRRAGSTATIAVAGYAQTAPAQWGTLHPRAWISDPLNRVIYEAHTYFDKDSSGHYAASYADELQRVAGSAPAQCQSLPHLTVSSPLTESGGSS